MPPAHRQLIETLSVSPSLRDFILSHSSSDLCQAFNACVSALVDLRSYHLNTVTKYIIVPGNQAPAMGCPLRGVGTVLNTRGTGGSSLMVFLKGVRNATQKNADFREAICVERKRDVIYSVYYITHNIRHLLKHCTLEVVFMKDYPDLQRTTTGPYFRKEYVR